MKKVAVVFPPKTKNTSKLYFRAEQLVQSLRKEHQVEVIEGISQTGTTSTRRPFVIRLAIFLWRLPRVISSIKQSDALLIFASPFWYLFIPLALRYKKRIVLDHFTTYLSHADYFPLFFLRPTLKRWDKKLYPRLDMVVTHTETMKRDLIALYGIEEERVKVLYSVVDIQLFDPQHYSKQGILATKKQLGIPENHAVVMYHGARHAFHGVEIIEQAAALLQDDPITFFFLGDPPPEVVPPGNLVYQTYVPFEDLPGFIAIADLWVGRFAGPNLLDPRGDRAASSCMFQAMAMARPVITAESFENEKVLDGGKAGQLIEPENPEALVTAIRQLLEDKKQAEQLGKAARDRIVRYFTLSEVDIVVESLFPKS